VVWIESETSSGRWKIGHNFIPLSCSKHGSGRRKEKCGLASMAAKSWYPAVYSTALRLYVSMIRLQLLQQDLKARMAADGDKVGVFFHPVLLPETMLNRFFEAVECFFGLSL
jgi:hypothetical protein